MSKPDIKDQVLKQLSVEPQPSLEKMADQLRVHRRTILRCIQAMQKESPPRVGEYDRASKRYPITEAGRRLTYSVRVDPEQLDALRLSAKIVRHHIGPVAADWLVDLLRQLGDSNGRRCGIDLSEMMWVRPTFLVDRSQDDAGPESFALICDLIRAAQERRAVWMEYFTASRQRLQQRTVEPRGLALIDDEWLLAARDPTEDKVKDFALHRIRSYRLGEVLTGRPVPFQLSRHFEGKFRSIAEGRPEVVRLLFSPPSALYVRERCWHASEIKTEVDRGLILELRVAASIELERWILGYGPDCEVLAPAELRERIQGRLRAAVEKY